MSWLTPRPRMISQLSSSLEKRLNFYALAASTAGLSVLTLAQPAEAKIVYRKTHQLIGLHHPYKLDLNHDGTMDFLIQETQAGSMGFKVNELATKEPKSNAVVHNGFKLTAMLTGFAYETLAGKSIKAGQEKGVADEDFGSDVSLTSPISDTPEPVTLGALAMGSPGLSIWRREESLDATE